MLSGEFVRLTKKDFGSIEDRAIEKFTITNDKGLVLSLINLGGIITSIRTPDRQGNYANIVLGHDTLEDYLNDTSYLGCLVGRYANRISNGTFKIDGNAYRLPCNEGENHLHGGDLGFNKKIWETEPYRDPRGGGLKLSMTSPDQDQGYPGTVDIQVLYLLSEDNKLVIDYTAATDMVTIINLTQHSYFNLNGTGDTLGHRVKINASGYTPVNKKQIPTGAYRSVEGSPLDLRVEKQLGALLDQTPEAELFGGGFDHNYVLDTEGKLENTAAILYSPHSGREMKVYTTEPGLQFYTGNNLGAGDASGKSTFVKHGGICLEAQHFPDSPNQRAFPSVILKPGHVYRQVTEYRFNLRSS
ncbi:MAG: galactose mutarotase [Desulfobulbaceae bacterium]|nr:MAG: galactose mutarotase [Desulfobulbaceae bacterium]